MVSNVRKPKEANHTFISVKQGQTLSYKKKKVLSGENNVFSLSGFFCV